MPRITHLSVVNDGGFSFGMDQTTPVSWSLSSRPRIRGMYRTWRVPQHAIDSQAFQAWAARNPAPVMSYRDMQATLRGFA